MNKLYLVFVWEDVEPEIQGPYADEDERDAAAGLFRAEEGDEHGIYRLDVNAQGEPSIDSFGGGEMDDLEDAGQWLLDHTIQASADAHLESDYEDRYQSDFE